MSLESHLIHTCRIERPDGTENVHGLADDSLTVVATAQECRLVVRQERVAVTDRAESPVVTTYTLLLPAGASIRQRDWITSVTLEDGSTMAERFRVESVLPRRRRSLSHISAALEKVA